jgi:hypothetical protein
MILPEELALVLLSVPQRDEIGAKMWLRFRGIGHGRKTSEKIIRIDSNR